MQCVNIENWSYCRYESKNFMAFVSFGMSPESAADDRMEYYVTVLENQEIEVFQKSFAGLNEACLYLNEHYSDWAFQDQLTPKSGCSTCAAH
jgi:hypothetical protein